MPSYTRSSLVTQVSELIGDTSNQQWSTSQIQDRLQKAQERFVSDTKCLTDTQTFSIVAGTSQYALLTETFDVLRVGITGKGKLKKSSKFDLDMYIGGDWTTTTGSPTNFYVDTSSTNKHITLFPIPQSADAGTNNLIIDCVLVPTVMGDDSSYALNGQGLLNPYTDAVIYYAASQLLLASNDPKDWQKAAMLDKQYLRKVTECVEIFNDLSSSTPLRIRLDGVGRVVNSAR